MIPVTIVGGCGQVGLPLGIALATVPDIRVSLLDINEGKVTLVNSGRMPFMERRRLGADPDRAPARF